MELHCYSVSPTEHTVQEEHFADDVYDKNTLESFLHVPFGNENLNYKDNLSTEFANEPQNIKATDNYLEAIANKIMACSKVYMERHPLRTFTEP